MAEVFSVSTKRYENGEWGARVEMPHGFWATSGKTEPDAIRELVQRLAREVARTDKLRLSVDEALTRYHRAAKEEL